MILLLHPHFPTFPYGYYLTEFVPRLFLELHIALILSSGKQFLDNYLRHSNLQYAYHWTALKNPIRLYLSHQSRFANPLRYLNGRIFQRLF